VFGKKGGDEVMIAETSSAVGNHVTQRRTKESNRLKLALVGGDALAIALGHVLVLQYVDQVQSVGWWRVLVTVVAGVILGLWAGNSQGLFLSRVSAVRALELSRGMRAMVIMSAAVLVLDRVIWLGLRVRYVVAIAALSWLFFVISRSIFRSWVSTRRERGQYHRSVVVVGTDGEASRLVEVFGTHTDLGISVVGVVGDREEGLRHNLGGLWLGGSEEVEEIVERLRVSGVVVSPGALRPTRLNLLIRNLQHSDVHVQLAIGVSGIDARRLKPTPISHEPLVYVEATTLSRLRRISKRAFDLVLAGLLLLAISPVLAVVALLIKLGDGGPVLFRQKRIGRDGEPFEVLKFRTMRVDAEEHLQELVDGNERNGPLFKMERDPRVTRVGHILRETSFDELPQLLNVLKGEMSLVGPRPALPSEVEQFSPDLRQRELVLPGITGLWQSEARDSPSFEAYRRLDLFYVENWSITLDLLIVLSTIEHLATRLLAMVFRRRATHSDEPAIIDGGIAGRVA